MGNFTGFPRHNERFGRYQWLSAYTFLFGGVVDESTYGTEVRGTTGYVILYGCNFTTPYGDTYISSSFGSPAYVSESQINLYYSIPTSTASGTRANDIGISTPYGSTSADFHVYDPAPAITSVSPNVWDAGTTTSFSLSGAGFGTSPSLSVTGTGILSYAKTSASDTQINGTVTVDANAPAQNVTITVTSNGYGSGFQSNGGYSNNIATTAQISPATVALNLSRSTLSLVNMAGYPSHGTYTVSSSLSSGNNSAFTVGLTSGMTPQTSPNSMTLTAAANSGPPLQGALKSVSAGFTANSTGGTATKTFSAAAFGMSCYLFAQESDWWNGSSCTSVTISGTTYSGSVTNPPSLTGSYCSAFLAETKLNGSGVSLNGTKIHYQGGNQYAVVSSFVGADGTPLVANGSVARDRSIVPSGTLWLDSIGANILANDTGGAITGYRLDLFKGTGQAACSGFGNPVVVGACNTPTSACPGSGVN
jgi:3D (Asp-Asp-Asp) domain-containing protein